MMPISCRAPLALVTALAVLAGCNKSPSNAAVVAPPSPVPVAVATPYTYADERAASERTVAEARAAIERGPVVWPQWQVLAQAQLAQTQLTGDYTGYREAEQSLAQAFALAGNGGPYLARARHNFTVHRLHLVEADLLRAERETDPDHVSILGLRADLAFYRGDYDAALAGYRAALARREDLNGLVRLALFHARMGHGSEAAALLNRADAITPAEALHTHAWLALQQGLLALYSGRWDYALAHYEHALRLLPGWWLAREHVAEIHALQGNADVALREYTDIIRDTGNPEFMDAMSSLLRARGDEAGAHVWITKARALYEQRLATQPEATYGHGLDHFLQFGTPQEALELARKNVALRPYGDSQIKLVDALLHAGETQEALKVIRAVLATDWNTAELHAAAARTFAAAGLAPLAREQAKLAKAMNPHAATQYGLPDTP